MAQNARLSYIQSGSAIGISYFTYQRGTTCYRKDCKYRLQRFKTTYMGQVTKCSGGYINGMTFPSAPDKKPDHYQVIIKSNDGSDIIADYSADGTVLQSRSIYKDAPLPQHVMASLENSRYKGWNVAGDKEIIKYDNSSEQH